MFLILFPFICFACHDLFHFGRCWVCHFLLLFLCLFFYPVWLAYWSVSGRVPPAVAVVVAVTNSSRQSGSFCIACKSTCLAGNLCVYSKAAPPTGDIGRGAETGLSGITIYSRIAAATLAVVVLRPAHRSIKNRRQRTAVQGLSGGWKPILQSDILWWHRRSLTYPQIPPIPSGPIYIRRPKLTRAYRIGNGVGRCSFSEKELITIVDLCVTIQ